MSTYLIKTPHTVENCLMALDAEAEKGREILGKFYYGCKEGDHTGYAVIDSNDKSDVWKLVPDLLRKDAKVIRVDKFTPEMIKSLHSKAA